MSRSGLVVALLVACSSNVTQVTTPPQVEQAAVVEQLAVASCPKVEDKPAVTRPTRPGRPGGLFGTDGLMPRATPQQGKTCQAARSTLDAANQKILGVSSPSPADNQTRAWDRKSDPARWARVAQRYGLDQRHRAALARDGFTVAQGASHWNFVEAYHEIFQSQLPIYVSIDSVLHAIYASHAGVIGDVEREILKPKLHKLLADLHCGLAAVASTWPRSVARDVDLYLTIARNLVAIDYWSTGLTKELAVKSLLGNDAEVLALLPKIFEAKGFEQTELFGRQRMIDFGAFQPRGRYSGAGGTYFRAMTWLSRIEFNLVSRSSRSSTMLPDRSETPREVAVGLALIDLAQSAAVLDDIAAIDAVWGELAGKREDVSFAELDALRAKAKLDRVSLTAQPALAAVIGNGYQRSIPTQPHPDGLTDLPVIAAMFGARVSPDAAAFAPIIQPAVPRRFDVGAADVAFILGHDRAKAHLESELQTFPELGRQLGVARTSLDGRMAGTDLYSMWLKAIRALAKPTAGTLPTHMKSDGFADLRMNSAVAAFGQLRSSYELMTGMAYLGSGCEIPDGYVEPAAEVYDALIAYAARGKEILANIDPEDTSKAQAYFTKLDTTLRVLRSIVATELAGKPLTEAQKQWLSMVVEIVMIDASGAPPTYAGWYFDLFRNFADATAQPELITGIAQNAERTMYLGTGEPRIGVFVIDTGGPPRVAVGPIAHAYETTAPTSEGRLTLDRYDAKPLPPQREPWAAGYLVAGGTKPKLTVTENWSDDTWLFDVESLAAVGPVTLVLLDHHRVPITSQTRNVGSGKSQFRFPRRMFDKVEMVQLKSGLFSAWAAKQTGGESSYGFWFVTTAEQEQLEKQRPPED
ncbi:MAG: DUF3160 domain-containing protein [Deltaproteobacteria bacterium]|nr:DUF3160 domain-containing protein [Deltaproteobacteria bacterium]